MMYRIGIGVFFLGMLNIWVSCSSPQELRESKVSSTETPPNGVYVGGNLYCDQTEMTNFTWMEYMFWVENIFGKDSPRYAAVLPDSTVWTAVGDSSGVYSQYYLTHPAYRDFPVVGISRQQALDYSKWRSDRVFELILSREGFIQYLTGQNSENYFTRESYYNGTFTGIIPGPVKQSYPEFRLPTKEEWLRIDQFADSVYNSLVQDCKSMKCRECLSRQRIRTGIQAFKKGETVDWPTVGVYDGCWKEDNILLFHIRGNVREWLDEPGLAAGWGWNDPGELAAGSEFAVTDSADAWTGFRNVCEWKRKE